MAKDTAIQKGTKVKLVRRPPGTRLPTGVIGTAEGRPGGGGTFLANFGDIGKYYVKDTEVEVVS